MLYYKLLAQKLIIIKCHKSTYVCTQSCVVYCVLCSCVCVWVYVLVNVPENLLSIRKFTIIYIMIMHKYFNNPKSNYCTALTGMGTDTTGMTISRPSAKICTKLEMANRISVWAI